MLSPHPIDALFVVFVLSVGALIGTRVSGPWDGIAAASFLVIVAYQVSLWWEKHKKPVCQRCGKRHIQL